MVWGGSAGADAPRGEWPLLGAAGLRPLGEKECGLGKRGNRVAPAMGDFWDPFARVGMDGHAAGV